MDHDKKEIRMSLRAKEVRGRVAGILFAGFSTNVYRVCVTNLIFCVS